MFHNLGHWFWTIWNMGGYENIWVLNENNDELLDWHMTPYEAVAIANALLHAVIIYENKNKSTEGLKK